MQRRTLRKLFGLLCLIAALSQGCSEATPHAATRLGTRWMVWLDLSGSVTDAQRAAWLEEARKVTARLAAGDTMAVFGIHESTIEAVPLYIGHMPTLRQSAGLHERMQVHAAQHQVRAQVTEAIEKALTAKANAKQTDLFGALDRFAPDDKGRPTVRYFFSDMEHATRELNMETMPLGKNMQNLLQDVIKRHGWRNTRLANTTVNCVLPGARGRARANSRLVLEQFWGTLFRTLGAELANFETYLKAS
jgi:hypothetical protein